MMIGSILRSTRLAASKTTSYRLAICVVAMLVIVGCDSGEDAPKTSLFEDDHEVPLHWPADVADISTKLRERLTAPDASAEVLAEIEDLVSWTAEVAADSNLPEADWVPLYQASESMTANLRSAKGALTPTNKTQLESLCELIDKVAQKIPEHLPKFEGGES